VYQAFRTPAAIIGNDGSFPPGIVQQQQQQQQMAGFLASSLFQHMKVVWVESSDARKWDFGVECRDGLFLRRGRKLLSIS